MNSVLFLSDYAKIPCIIDWQTKNNSFIHMAGVLKRMGIKNHTFMLVLTQPELQGVDPFSPDLTQDQILKISMEAKLNPWYLVRECIRVPMQGGEATHFILNRANLAQIWCFLNSVDSFITIARQIGKTYGAIMLADALVHIWGENIELGMFAKDNDLRLQNVRRFKLLRDSMPQYLFRPGRKFYTDNQESIEYRPNKTKYITFVACPSRKVADGQGRGYSFVSTHWDEFAFYENNDLSYPAAIAATDTAMPNARANGLPCANLITTTAGYTATPAGKYAYDIKNKALRFDESLYDLEDRDALVEILERSSTNNYVYIEFSYKQLGRDDAWFKTVTTNKPQEVIDRDYLNRWIHSSGESVVPKALLDLLQKNIAAPISVTIVNGILINWYAYQKHLDQPHIKSLPFIIGSDSADNIGKDFTTLVILHPGDMSVVATCRCNQSNMLHVAEVILKLLERFPRAVFIPERNRAATLLDILIERMMTEPRLKMDPMRRIFNYFVHDIDSSNTTSANRDYSLGSVRRQFGFKTTHAEDSRNLLYSKVMMTTIERNHTRIYDQIIVEEISGLVVRNGRIDHKVSGNDDMLMGYLMACWFVMYGKNLHRYGINPNEILQITGDGALPEENGVSEIRERVRYLEECLKSQRNTPMISRAYACELKELNELLEHKTGGVERIAPISLNQQAPERSHANGVSIANLQSTLHLINL
jgi:hypothetical protein